MERLLVGEVDEASLVLPEWTGLEALLPLELCGPFMWMGAIDLADGTRIGAYKHNLTRRYLHLDPGGVPFGYRDRDAYCRVRHHDAIEHVFNPSWLLRSATEDERAALVVALDCAMKRDRHDRAKPPATRI